EEQKQVCSTRGPVIASLVNPFQGGLAFAVLELDDAVHSLLQVGLCGNTLLVPAIFVARPTSRRPAHSRELFRPGGQQQLVPTIDFFVQQQDKRRLFLIESDYVSYVRRTRSSRICLRRRGTGVTVVGELFLP